MIKKIITFFSMLSFLSFFSVNVLMAQSYQFEGSGMYQYEKSDNSKASTFGLSLTAYFDQVNTDGVLLGEAAFMQKAGYVDIIGMYGKMEEGGGDFKITPAFVEADLNYVFPVPVFITAGASYLYMTGDYSFKATNTALNCGIGYFIQDGFAVSAEYQRDIKKTEMEFTPDTETTGNTFKGKLKYVTMFQNNMGINLEGACSYISVEEDSETVKGQEYEIAGDFYLTPAISIGASVAITKSDDTTEEEKAYSARVSAFVIPSFAISAEYTMSKSDADSSDDSNSFTVMLTGRM